MNRFNYWFEVKQSHSGQGGDTMEYIRSPLNYLGNKYRYLPQINGIIRGRSYSSILDLFMGTGNILLNMEASAKTLVGVDKVPLVPMLYRVINTQKKSFTIGELQRVVHSNNDFSCKEDYYLLRARWNAKYTELQMDRQFIYETVLMFKMCSNSMIRFNSRGEFNQGYRGQTRPQFFSDQALTNCVAGLETLRERIRAQKFRFFGGDFREFLTGGMNDLLILDPPYTTHQAVYSGFSPTEEKALFSLMENTPHDFIYFNYLVNRGEVYTPLDNLVNTRPLKVIYLPSNPRRVGQGSRGDGKDMQEVIVTNIRG